MAKARIGHVAEAKVLQALDVDMIDESEVLTPADKQHHIWKTPFLVPFVCGASDLGSALRRIAEGASMIRLKGRAGTGDVLFSSSHRRLRRPHTNFRSSSLPRNIIWNRLFYLHLLGRERRRARAGHVWRHQRPSRTGRRRIARSGEAIRSPSGAGARNASPWPPARHNVCSGFLCFHHY
jgi:hypothetical protein